MSGKRLSDRTSQELFDKRDRTLSAYLFQARLDNYQGHNHPEYQRALRADNEAMNAIKEYHGT